MIDENRRQVLRSGVRTLVATALGALAVSLGLRRGGKTTEGYCHRAGRCGGCGVTADCGAYQVTHLAKGPK